MKKVLHIIQSLDTGGAERVVAEYALAHDRKRYSPEVCCVLEGGYLVGQLEEAGVPVHVLRRGKRLNLSALLRLARLMARGRFDVVHNHNFTALAIGVPAAVLAGVNVLVRTEHNVTRGRRGVRDMLSRLAALREDAQIAVSDAVRRSHVEARRLSPGRFATVRNGIDGARLALDGDRAETRRSAGWAPDAFVCLSVGSLTRQKDFTNLLAAAAKVAAERPDVRFVVVGEGAEEQALLSLRHDLGLDERVSFVGRSTDVPGLLKAADAFVLPSAWEGLPITMLEAMAARVPCVVTRAGGVDEILEDGKSGLVVPARDHDALANAILSLASDESLRADLAAAASAVFDRRCTAKGMARQTEALYDLAASGRADLAAAGPMKVLLVIGQLSLGGAERQVAELATRLPRDRYEPVVCCFSDGGPLKEEFDKAGVRVVCIGKRSGVASGASCSLGRLIREERPAIVHSYLFSANWRTVLVGRLMRVPLVITSVRNVDIHSVPAFVWMERILSGMNDVVIANAEAVREYVARAHWIERSRIKVIMNGVAPERVGRLLKTTPREAGRTVLLVASLTPKKDHATFLRAAREVARRVQEARFVLVGDGPLRSRLESLAEDMGLGDRVEFRGEMYDIAGALAEADVCALTSVKEGCSNFLLESMLAGRPVVATDAGGNRELVEEGRTGYVVPVGDSAAVADRLVRLLDDPPLARQMGEAGRESALRRFTVERMVDETMAVYEETLRLRLPGLVEWGYARAARGRASVGEVAPCVSSGGTPVPAGHTESARGESIGS